MFNFLIGEDDQWNILQASEGENALGVIEVLLRNSADKSINNKNGETAYDIAKLTKDEENMILLK